MERNREMSNYFGIYQGLRGCYMPDSVYIIHAKTRRDLKAALVWEAESIRDAGAIGCSKRSIAWLANAAWKARRKGGDYIAPYKWKYQSSYCNALGVFPNMSRREYLNQEGMN